ncbi:hypothetical protein EK904_003324 [Melospiza melodia maxima]|nr:hypothetical protein EK904_003324 [Melospiza melodia maxima]
MKGLKDFHRQLRGSNFCVETLPGAFWLLARSEAVNQQPQPGLLRLREAEGRGEGGKGKWLLAAGYGPSESGRARRRGGTHRRGAERSGDLAVEGRGVQATHPAAARPCQRSGNSPLGIGITEAPVAEADMKRAVSGSPGDMLAGRCVLLCHSVHLDKEDKQIIIRFGLNIKKESKD